MNKAEIENWIEFIDTHRGVELESIELSLEDFLKILKTLNDPFCTVNSAAKHMCLSLIWLYSEQKFQKKMGIYNAIKQNNFNQILEECKHEHTGIS